MKLSSILLLYSRFFTSSGEYTLFIDLEEYEYGKKTSSLIRATEGTVEEIKNSTNPIVRAFISGQELKKGD